MEYEVISITIQGETSVSLHPDMDSAFTACTDKWSTRKAGSPVFAVRDCNTDQRWSYSDIKELVSHVS